MMLQNRYIAQKLPEPEEEFAAVNDLSASVERLAAAAARQWRLFTLLVGLGLAGAIAFLFVATPVYTSSVSILIEQSTSRILTELVDAEGLLADEADILNQIEVIRSERIAERVVDLLDLTNDEAFMQPPAGVVGSLRQGAGGLVELAQTNVPFLATEEGGEPQQQAFTDREMAIWILMENLSVWRSGRTSVLVIAYTSPDPAQAASIARAYGEAYLADVLDAKLTATRSASEWLERRIDALKRRSIETDLAVQRFKAEHSLFETNGQFVSDQNLTSFSDRLVEAQAATARAKARFDRIQEMISTGDANAVVTDALDSSLINQLRGRYLEASKRESELRDLLGEDHAQVKRLQAEMGEFRRLIFEELRRIADSYRNELEVAELQEKAVRDSVSDAASETVVSNEVRVQLRELERESETYRTLYQTFLQRYQESVQQESIPNTEARIISDAKVPSSPSAPNTLLVLALGLFAGGVAGAGAGTLREFRDRFFRTGDQVREELGLSFLGSTPVVNNRPSPASVRRSGDAHHPGMLNKINAASSHVIDHPLSQFAETMRSAKFAADVTMRDRKPKVIGVVSIIPGEGKSTISINFAEMLASMGVRTLLIDGDLRKPGVTKAVASHAREGLVEALVERRELGKLVLRNPDTGLAVLPAFAQFRINHTSELLASRAMGELLEEAGKEYDYIVVDLPPIAPVIDARAISSKIDGFILVVEWGKTSRKAVKSLMRSEPLITERCLGVILNKVDPKKLKYYAAHGTSEYYSPTYANYHRPGRH